MPPCAVCNGTGKGTCDPVTRICQPCRACGGTGRGPIVLPSFSAMVDCRKREAQGKPCVDKK